MNYRYAQTDGSNKVMSLFTSTKLEDSAALILLSEGQTPQLGATYDSSQGTFTAPPAPPSGAPDYPMVSKTRCSPRRKSWCGITTTCSRPPWD